VVSVTAAVMCLMASGGKVPKDRSWKAAKGMMNKVSVINVSVTNASVTIVSVTNASVINVSVTNVSVYIKYRMNTVYQYNLLLIFQVDAFLDSLINYDKENIPDACLKAVDPYLNDPEFEPDFIRGKSFAAAGLCAWAKNIVT